MEKPSFCSLKDRENFEGILLGHFIKHRPLISEECICIHFLVIYWMNETCEKLCEKS